MQQTSGRGTGAQCTINAVHNCRAIEASRFCRGVLNRRGCVASGPAPARVQSEASALPQAPVEGAARDRYYCRRMPDTIPLLSPMGDYPVRCVAPPSRRVPEITLQKSIPQQSWHRISILAPGCAEDVERHRRREPVKGEDAISCRVR